MHIERLDHVNVQTHDLEGTRNFFVDVIGLTVGERPPFGFRGYWLYDDSVAVIHLTGLDADEPRCEGSGSINHIAFRATGLAATRERLGRAGVGFEERIVPRNGELQIFLTDPNGIGIELTFGAAEVRPQEAAAHSAWTPAGR